MEKLRNKVIINRTNRAIFAQCVDKNGKTIVGKRFSFHKGTSPVESSQKFGEEFGALIKDKKIDKICFLRNGKLYHGRVKSFAEGMRKAGINF